MFGATRIDLILTSRLKAFFTSPRNSIAAHKALFDALECHILLTPSSAPPVTEQILVAHQMKHLHIPSVENLIDKPHRHYEFNKTYEANRTDPMLAM